MPTDIIQWFPGHMAKTRRMIGELLPQIDLVIELLDARIPYSSANPELPRMVGNKPVLTVLTKSSLADPAATAEWKKYFEAQGRSFLAIDTVTGEGMTRLLPGVRAALAEKIDRNEKKGMGGRTLKLMIAGIPNVGKSSLINKLTGEKKAKVENRPGVTRDKQWVPTGHGFDLLDTPGVLWPKFEDRRVGENLAMTGAIKDDVVETVSLAVLLVGRLRSRAPSLFAARYKLGEMGQYAEKSDAELFEIIARKRGFLISGGEIDEERCAGVLLDEFRAAKIGRITLELPSDLSGLQPGSQPGKEPAADEGEKPEC